MYIQLTRLMWDEMSCLVYYVHSVVSFLERVLLLKVYKIKIRCFLIHKIYEVHWLYNILRYKKYIFTDYFGFINEFEEY